MDDGLKARGEALFLTLVENSPHAVMIYRDDRLIFANQAAERMSGYKAEELCGMDFWEIIHPRDQGLVKTWGRLHQEGDAAGISRELKILCKDGQEKLVDLAVATAHVNGSHYGMICAADVSERMGIAGEPREGAVNYRRLFEEIPDFFHETNGEGRLTAVSPSVEKLLGYRAEELVGREVSELYLDPKRSEEFLSRLAQEGEVHDFEAPMRAKDGKIVLVSTHARCRRDEKGTVLGVQGVTRDVTARGRAEEGFRQSLEDLRRAIGGVICVAAEAVEIRDPYTAGHQRRCSHLAGAIAQELALPPTVVESVAIAGMIHDLGKIGVPAELLAKPARLAEAELALIRQHASMGYEILKKIEFPWPLAQIVLQHHERLDGSGYPVGLKDGAILMEARIVAAAEVVEAISSHRPYRPALGIEAALAEIEQGKGILYDEAVAEACLRLFREKGWMFPAVSGEEVYPCLEVLPFRH